MPSKPRRAALKQPTGISPKTCQSTQAVDSASIVLTAQEAANAVALFDLAARAVARIPGNDVGEIAKVAVLAAGLAAKMQEAFKAKG